MTTRHIYSGIETIEEYVLCGAPADPSWTLAREFVWGSSFPEPVALIDHTALGDKVAGVEEVLHYVRDELGNVVGLTNAGDPNASPAVPAKLVERYDYDPYGRTYIEHRDPNGTWVRTGASYYGNSFAWTAQRYDAGVRMYGFFARTYSPELGRWLQRDPAGHVDGTNLYQYVRSMATRTTDPLGFGGFLPPVNPPGGDPGGGGDTPLPPDPNGPGGNGPCGGGSGAGGGGPDGGGDGGGDYGDDGTGDAGSQAVNSWNLDKEPNVVDKGYEWVQHHLWENIFSQDYLCSLTDEGCNSWAVNISIVGGVAIYFGGQYAIESIFAGTAGSGNNAPPDPSEPYSPEPPGGAQPTNGAGGESPGPAGGGTSGGRGSNHQRPGADAEGPHSSFRRDPRTGEITHYETYEPQSNPQNPNPWESTKRYDGTGRSHTNKATGEAVPTPHVHDPSAPGGVRPAEP